MRTHGHWPLRTRWWILRARWPHTTWTQRAAELWLLVRG
jgi:hypothetical protein